jgi:hypothetical protein
LRSRGASLTGVERHQRPVPSWRRFEPSGERRSCTFVQSGQIRASRDQRPPIGTFGPGQVGAGAALRRPAKSSATIGRGAILAFIAVGVGSPCNRARYSLHMQFELTRMATAWALPLVLCVAVLGGACRARPASPLLREFEGSYPREAQPNGTVRAFEITAAEAELPLLEGGRLKVWAYNGQVPGPTLRVGRGDTVRVQFHNRLSQPSTIHWHGVRVPNGMDGVPHLTQPPVEPGGSFLYEFVPKDAGTFWFHPHVRSSEQVERGLYGVLIVEDELPRHRAGACPGDHRRRCGPRGSRTLDDALSYPGACGGGDDDHAGGDAGRGPGIAALRRHERAGASLVPGHARSGHAWSRRYGMTRSS